MTRNRRTVFLAVSAVMAAVAGSIVAGSLTVGAGHGSFARGDVFVAHEGGVQWWHADGTMERRFGTDGRTNFGMAFDAAGNLYAAYKREVWTPRQKREEVCVAAPPGASAPNTTTTTTTLLPPPTIPAPGPPPPPPPKCQTLWPETSWVSKFTPSGYAGELAGGAPPEDPCRQPTKPGRPPAGRIPENCRTYLPRSIVFDEETAYLGAALGNVVKIGAGAGPANYTHFDPPPHIAGVSFADLAPDKCTLLYTSVDPALHRFNVCSGEAMPDLVPALPASAVSGGHLYGVRVRTNGEVLVGSTDGVHRLSAAGVPLRTYRVGTAKRFFAVALDPDDRTFWTATSDGRVYRIDIDTGNVLNLNRPIQTGMQVLGLVVKGGPLPPPPPTPPVVNIQDAAAVPEGDSGRLTADFPVTLSAASAQAVTVDFATADGSAAAIDGDYEQSSATFRFDPGQTSGFIRVPVMGDTTQEQDETFSVVLSNPSGATVARAQATATILNDDAPATTPQDPATGPGGGGSNQQNQQTRPENAPPSGTTGGGGTSPSPVSANAPTPVNGPSPVQAPAPVSGAAPVPGAAPVASPVATPSAVGVGSAAPTPAPVSSPVPMAGAVAGPAPAGVPGAPMTAQNPAPAGGELRPGRPSGVRNHEMVRHSGSGDDEAGMAGATAGATLLFGCFMVGVVWASRRRERFRGLPAWNEASAPRASGPPQPEQRERW